MAERNYLAFDFGAESGRAILGRLRDGRLVLEERHRFANPHGRINNELQWDLLGQWEQIKQGLKNTREDKLDGIGVDTWGVDFGLLDESGRILGNPVHYRDARTDGMFAHVFNAVPRDAVFEATGIQFMELNTLYQLAAMARQETSLLKIARRLLFMPDLFHYLLTGVAKNEFSIASTSQMYDPRGGDWARPLLEAIGLPTYLLGEIVPSGTVLGPLLGDVAAECGIRPAPVIAPATHDTASAVASVPAEEGTNWCYISSGTWSLMGVELPRPVINEKSLAYNYTNEGGVGGSIRFLKNIMGMWLIQECRRHFSRQGHDYSYAELAQMASRAKAFDIIINPEHAPFLAPGGMPDKIAAYCQQTGQRAPATHGAAVRACVDALALKYRATLEGLEDMLGRRIDVIHIVGGGTQNQLLNQLTADVCERPVVAGPVEATAIGNILVQAIATGAVASLAAARQIVRENFAVTRYEPRPGTETRDAYDRYVSLIARS